LRCIVIMESSQCAWKNEKTIDSVFFQHVFFTFSNCCFNAFSSTFALFLFASLTINLESNCI
jgi:hypothetical protein